MIAVIVGPQPNHIKIKKKKKINGVSSLIGYDGSNQMMMIVSMCVIMILASENRVIRGWVPW